ncbi:deoxyribodipyrimidine photolyase [Arthrobacter livingstonensis]|uniref:Deoxyribodipyrimidine photolyase n=1 Tax=Arthrobacter livingstonensis TaxID=670078 RepID=A0A2V5L4W1_9MICC|nr:deoxyribodipyrimidine photo-lyase [Arthrobacter livingstonensis]PYI65174.1 deoxyribodipyrimidine photolyase [Arthrobacter livingstonensis]
MTNPAVRAVHIAWFRDDLRIADNPALFAALEGNDGGTLTIAVYVHDEVSENIRPLGSAARWWLHHGLRELRAQLSELGVPLVLHQGTALLKIPEATEALRQHFGLNPEDLSVYWNRRYGGGERAVDASLMELLRGQGATVSSFSATLLHEPWTVQTQEQRPYKVFTPFHNAAQLIPLRPALPAPSNAQQARAPEMPAGEELDSWGLLPSRPDWSAGLAAAWTPGEAAAHERLGVVLQDVAADYLLGRDRPGIDGTSRLSPALRWGHLSPVQVWEALGAVAATHPEAAEGARAMMRQLAWRDFCWNQLYHRPDLGRVNLRTEFNEFDWAWPTGLLPTPASGRPAAKPPTVPSDAVQGQINALHEAWCRGETGFPLVDAGMRELWETGWMHNRVRMVTASLLVKNLGIHWRAGEAWFWDTLVDADPASNPANWQWVAGCGADAAPYFRVFNPVLQAKKFDAQGRYRARFGPLLNQEPVVDLKESRAAALAAYEHMRHSARTGDAHQP